MRMLDGDFPMTSRMSVSGNPMMASLGTSGGGVSSRPGGGNPIVHLPSGPSSIAGERL